jgi:hypothetical protein
MPASIPLRILQSTGLTLDAQTFKITCPGRTMGFGISDNLNPSTVPCSSNMIAFIMVYENRS